MEVIEAFRKTIGSIASIPPSQWAFVINKLGVKKLKRGEVYFQQGDSFDEIGFVIQGLMCNSYAGTDGAEYVKNFVWEGNPVTCYSDLIRNRPASFSSKALERTTLVTLKYKHLATLYERHACWERVGRLSAEKLFVEKEYREWQFLSLDTKARYESFVRENPRIVNRIPQYLIASYLGVSPVSLSRIRKR